MTTYNAVERLDTSVQSVVDQTYPDIEIIIVDDASDDGTSDAVAKWVSKDSRITGVVLPFGTLGGIGQATNRGIDMCQGEYVAFVAASDEIHPEMIDQMVVKAEQLRADMVVVDFNTIDDQHQLEEITQDQEYWVRLVDGPQKAILGLTAKKDAALFFISPGPWRTLYSRKWLNAKKIRFPEGDYFYEENTFNWATLVNAKKIGVVDEVLLFQRRFNEGEGSLTEEHSLHVTIKNAASMPLVKPGVSNEKLCLLGILLNINRVAKLLSGKDDAIYLVQFFTWALRSSWILRFPRSKEIRRKLEGIWFKTVNRWYSRAPRWYKQSPGSKALREALAKFGKHSSIIDVTIVIPCHNAKEDVLRQLEYFTDQDIWTKKHTANRARFEVIVVGDHSTDGLYEATETYREYSNFLYVHNYARASIGRARNIGIGLAEGKYLYFLNPGDQLDVEALGEAYADAAKTKTDIMFVPYNISKDGQLSPMPETDERQWLENDAHKLTRSRLAQKSAVYTLSNFPGNRLVKTDVLLAGDMFFGPTEKFNEIQYHWVMIAQANSFRFFHKPVCILREVEENPSTKLKDRLALIDAVEMTDRVLSGKRFYDGAPNERQTVWFKFVKEKLLWAKGIQGSTESRAQSTCDQREKSLLTSLAARDPRAQAILQDLRTSPDLTLGEWSSVLKQNKPLGENKKAAAKTRTATHRKAELREHASGAAEGDEAELRELASGAAEGDEVQESEKKVLLAEWDTTIVLMWLGSLVFALCLYRRISTGKLFAGNTRIYKRHHSPPPLPKIDAGSKGFLRQAC
jgi:glycosyltransferase involved in cell wall biosynthesis